MTEKQYGGATGRTSTPKPAKVKAVKQEQNLKEKKEEYSAESGLDIQKYKQAGKIASEAVKYAKTLIKPGMKLLEIADKIEAKIIELGGKPAFPTNLSINDIAAHYTPSYNDNTLATGLLKVDLGVSVDGFIADTAFSLDLENNEENKKLIEAAEKALNEAIKTAKSGIEVWKIGEAIQNKITEFGFSPIRNLSGHELGEHMIHAGLTIPNCNNGNKTELTPGAYAIEPFSTTGQGIVYEGKPSGIYRYVQRKGMRDMLARKIIDFIEENYLTLPFCSRWIVKAFGPRSLLALSLLEKTGVLNQYPQLIEKSHEKVAQAEHTLIITDKTEVTTA